MKKVLIFLCIVSLACQEKVSKPSFISFKIVDDSLSIIAKNKLPCPTLILLETTNARFDTLINLQAKEQKEIIRFHHKEMDTLEFLKTYHIRMLYGNHPTKPHDSLYNYALPFLKGKRYKIIQGHFGKFSHQSDFSKFAIDVKMNVGQTVCAMRDGVVVGIKDDSNEGGNSKKYYDMANYILLYHKDGTFSQYVHLKHKGSLVTVGDSVIKGQPIGLSGNTGYSTTPHLHFGVFKTTLEGFKSIPYQLDSIPSHYYTKGKFAIHN